VEPKAEQSWKIKFGWKSLQGSGIVKFRLYSPLGLIFSATFRSEANEKIKVRSRRLQGLSPINLKNQRAGL